MKTTLFKGLVLLVFAIFSNISISNAQSFKELSASLMVLLDSNKLDSALYLSEKALALSESVISKADSSTDMNERMLFLNDSTVIFLNFMNNYANYLKGQGQHDASERIYKLIIGHYSNYYSDDDNFYASKLTRLAFLYQSLSRCSESIPLFKKAMDLYKKNSGDTSTNYTNSMQNLGTQYYEMGDFQNAMKYYQQSYDVKLKIFGHEAKEMTGITGSLALALDELGYYAEAEALYQRALKMALQYDGDKSVGYSTVLNNMGTFYQSIGQYERAEGMLKTVVQIDSALFGADSPDLTISLNNIGTLYCVTGRYKETIPIYDRILAINKKNFGEDHPKYALTLNNYALLYENMGQYDKSIEYYKKTIDIWAKSYGENSQAYCKVLNNLGRVYKDIGNYDQALEIFNKVLEIRSKNLGEEHIDYTASMNDLAELYYLKGDNDKAELYWQKTCEHLTKNINRYFIFMSDKEKSTFYNFLIKNRLNNYLSFASERAVQNPAILKTLYNNQLLQKGILLNSSKKLRETINNSNDSLIKETFEKWQNQRSELSKLYTMSKKDVLQNPVSIDSLEKAANESEKFLTLKSSQFAKDFSKKSIKVEDIQKSLNNTEAAIEIIRFDKFGMVPDKFSAKQTIPGLTDSIKYIALIVTRNSINYVLIENGNELEDEEIARYSEIIQKQSKNIMLLQDDIDDMGAMYKQFWKPLSDKLEGIKTVYISLDGVYNQFNLNTLQNPDTKKYVLDEIDLRILTSTRDLIGSKNNKPGESWPEEFSAKLFGDPKFNLKNEINTGKVNDPLTESTIKSYYLGGLLDYIVKRGINPLPGTKIEINKISSDFKKKKLKAEIYTGDAALEDNLKAARNPKVLHIATHGVFLKDVEYMTDMIPADGTKQYVENPLLRSMLLFAGAENSIKGETTPDDNKDDGILTAYEAMNLNLDNTELVVLSACKTGLGEVKNGEGVNGLQGAFQIAGAKSLIMSLWSVEDNTTQELMADFYQHWLDGAPKRQAFRTAQQHLKDKYPEPYYWGAFVMVGE